MYVFPKCVSHRMMNAAHHKSNLWGRFDLLTIKFSTRSPTLILGCDSPDTMTCNTDSGASGATIL